MTRQISPFAALTGAEKQIRWLEYQSIRLPYVEVDACEPPKQEAKPASEPPKQECRTQERPQPPPEVPRSFPVTAEFQKTRHSQYDAVIARLKQAELQSRRQSPL